MAEKKSKKGKRRIRFRFFTWLILAVILIAAVLVGLQALATFLRSLRVLTRGEAGHVA